MNGSRRNQVRMLAIWRWRRVCRRGVVMANRRRWRRPAPAGVAYTWLGACVGDATRDQLAAVLSGPPPRPENYLSLEYLARLRAEYEDTPATKKEMQS